MKASRRSFATPARINSPSHDVRWDPGRCLGRRDSGEDSQAAPESEPVIDRMRADFLIWHKVDIEGLGGRQ
jgi:hypothetical protein